MFDLSNFPHISIILSNSQQIYLFNIYIVKKKKKKKKKKKDDDDDDDDDSNNNCNNNNNVWKVLYVKAWNIKIVFSLNLLYYKCI